MNEEQAMKKPKHPIGVVSARTGIPQDLLRAWEKRYRAVVPGRSPTGRRLFSDEDVEKLRLLKRAITGGRRIGDVASLSIRELREMIIEDDSEVAVPSPPYVAGTSTDGHLKEALSAVEDLDKNRLEKTLAVAAVSLSGPYLRQQVLVPLMQAVGDRWQQGTLRIAHEHMASAVVRSFLAAVGRANGKPPSAPRLILTTPSGQRHELGALIVASVAEEYGWDVTYLGPDLPAEEIAAAAALLKPRVVGLSVVYKTGNIRVQEEVRKLVGYIDPDVLIVVGGNAVSSLKPFLEDINVRCVEDLAQFQDELASITG